MRNHEHAKEGHVKRDGEDERRPLQNHLRLGSPLLPPQPSVVQISVLIGRSPSNDVLVKGFLVVRDKVIILFVQISLNLQNLLLLVKVHPSLWSDSGLVEHTPHLGPWKDLHITRVVFPPKSPLRSDLGAAHGEQPGALGDGRSSA